MILVMVSISLALGCNAMAGERNQINPPDFIHYGAEMSATWAAGHRTLADFVEQSELGPARKSEILDFLKTRKLLNRPPPEFRATARGFVWVTPGKRRTVEFFSDRGVYAKVDGTMFASGPKRPFSELFLDLKRKFSPETRGGHARWFGVVVPAAHAQMELVDGAIAWLGARITATADWIASCPDHAGHCVASALKKKLNTPESLARLQCENGRLTYVQRISHQGNPVGMRLTHDASGHPSGYQSFAENWGSGFGQPLCQYSFDSAGKVTESKVGDKQEDSGTCLKIGSNMEEAARFPIQLMDSCCGDPTKQCENEMNGWINTLWKDREKPRAPHWSPPSQQQDSDPNSVS